MTGMPKVSKRSAPLRLHKGAVLPLAPSFVRLAHNKVFVRVRCEVPVCANAREVPMARAARAKKQRALGTTITREALAQIGVFGALPEMPVLVTFVRRGISCDDDNLAGAFKAFRDGLADAIGIDDRHTRESKTTRALYTFRYEQGPSQRSDKGFDLTIELPNHLGRTA